MAATLHINLFHFQADHDEPFLMLTATSERLTSMGVIPRKGERIVVQKDDDRWLADRPAPGAAGPPGMPAGEAQQEGAGKDKEKPVNKGFDKNAKKYRGVRCAPMP